METDSCQFLHQDVMVYDIEGAGEIEGEQGHLQASVPHVRDLGHQVHPVCVGTASGTLCVLVIG